MEKIMPSKSDWNNLSDSGYNDSSSTLPSKTPLTPEDSTINPSSLSYHNLPPLKMSQEAMSNVAYEVAPASAEPDPNAGGSGSDRLNVDLEISPIDFDSDFYADNFSNTDCFNNYDIFTNLDKIS
jgi:hypothetical protein